MDADGFLSGVRQIKGEIDRPVYRLDLAEYKNREIFLDAIRETLECSFQQFCELISQSGTSILLMDNFPAGAASDTQGQSADRDVEDLVNVILEYCPKLTIIIRSRRAPLSHVLPAIQLMALDEADLRTYVLEHERGGSHLASASAISTLLRHTDGIPTRVDRALKELEVIGLPELVNTESDLTALSVVGHSTSPSLAKLVQSLHQSTDPTQVRTFSLLKVLSIFPQGEQLQRIKRFNPVAPFFPAHAAELLEQALIEVATMQRIDSGGSGSLAKTLVVPRPVRECVRDLMDPEDVRRMNHRGAEIYFGPQWVSGLFKFPTGYKFDEPHCGSADMANASTIIIRLLKEAVNSDEVQQISRSLGLAEFYLRALLDGDHYHNAVIFCDDLVPTIPISGFEEKKATIRAFHARSLRMLGQHEQSKATTLEIINYPTSNSNRQTILLNLALCHHSLNENDDAKKVAEEIIKLDRHSNMALQAKALLIELETSGPKRTKRLIQMEALCRKEGADVVANNIALLRAREAKDNPDQVRQILMPVVKPGRNKEDLNNKNSSDFYNKTRAALKLAELSLNAGERLSERDLLYLVSAYHFLFNERLPALFDQCHDSLWRTFEKTGEIQNLLTLFRHSSLYWRLSGRDSMEAKYVKKLSNGIGKTISERMSNLNRESAYYLVRATAQSLPKISKRSTEGLN